MLTLYLIRHGQTESNINSVIMGGMVDTPLTEEGMQHIGRIIQKLTGIRFEEIYSSDLGRAFMTAYHIKENLNLPANITPRKELREMNYGIYSNMKKEDVRKKCPQYKTDPYYIFPDGESFAQMQQRVVNYVNDLEERHKNKSILVVAHSGVVRALICYFKRWYIGDYLNLKIPHIYVGVFSINNGDMLSYKEI